MRMQTFEQLHGVLIECNTDLIVRVMKLKKEGKVGSDVIELADGDQEAVNLLKAHYDMKGNQRRALNELKKPIALLEAYHKRIIIVQNRIADLISDREIGVKSAKSLPILRKSKKSIGNLADTVLMTIQDSKSLPAIKNL